MLTTRLFLHQLFTKCQLQERLTFDTLFAYSEPKRILRSKTVRGPELAIETYTDSMSYFFNFKSYPSTTGSRWKGYIRFFAPDDPDVPLEQVECEVDCGCPDYRYRWAWANNQRDSSPIGDDSVNQCIDRAPRITNPGNVPGLCKHLLALRDFLWGQDARFVPSDEVDSGTGRRSKLMARAAEATRLAQLAQQANGVVLNAAGQPVEPDTSATVPSAPPDGPAVEPAVPADVPNPADTAVDQERVLRRRQQLRTVGVNPDSPNVNPTNPTNPQGQNRECLTKNRVVKGMVINAKPLQEMLAGAQAAQQAPPQTAAPSSGDQALAHLQKISDLLAQLVELNTAPEPENVPDLPAGQEPPEIPPEEQEQAPQQPTRQAAPKPQPRKLPVRV